MLLRKAQPILCRSHVPGDQVWPKPGKQTKPSCTSHGQLQDGTKHEGHEVHEGHEGHESDEGHAGHESDEGHESHEGHEGPEHHHGQRECQAGHGHMGHQVPGHWLGMAVEAMRLPVQVRSATATGPSHSPRDCTSASQAPVDPEPLEGHQVTMTFVDQPLVHVFLEGHYGPYQDQLMRWKKGVHCSVQRPSPNVLLSQQCVP